MRTVNWPFFVDYKFRQGRTSKRSRPKRQKVGQQKPVSITNEKLRSPTAGFELVARFSNEVQIEDVRNLNVTLRFCRSFHLIDHQLQHFVVRVPVAKDKVLQPMID